MYTIIGLSILMQLAAAGLALRLIPLTGRIWSWIFISTALLVMVVRRLYTLMEIVRHEVVPDMEFQLLGLVISAGMFLGIALIAPIFKRLNEANRKLAENERRFKTVADFTHDWEYWRGPDGNFIYMSPSCVRVTGYPRREFMADSDLLERIIHPDDRKIMSEHMAGERHDREVGDLDFRIISADGSVHWIAHRCMPVFDEQGNYLGVRAGNRNIDHRKNAEDQLRESRRQYHDLVEQARCIILELNIRGEIMFINEYGLDFFGRSFESTIGRPVVGTIIPETDYKGRKIEAEIGEFLLRGRDIVCMELESLHQNGTKVWVSWANSMMRGESGKPMGVLCVGIDVTQRKAAERMKEDVERIVRHDLKSPLTGIIGIPGLLKSDENITSKQKEMLQAVEDAGNQMLNLINNSLNLYKMELGTYDYRPEKINWPDVAEAAFNDLTLGKKNLPPVEFDLEGRPLTAGDEVLVWGDMNLMYAMCANLMKNALEASGGKTITVRFKPGSRSVMEISNAVPVPEDIRDGFFDKYVTSGKRGGTGLGTYSARLSAEVMGGSIKLLVDHDGTTIRVVLPGCTEA